MRVSRFIRKVPELPKPEVLCWICNKEPALTAEHRSKRSDINDQLGKKGPFFLHTDERKNVKLQSSKSDRLKFWPSLCENCNSSRTQPHDLAWEQLSNYLRNGTLPFNTGEFFRANKVFLQDASAQMLNVQLFFVKWLGCEIVESHIPTDPGIESFAQAIMNGTAHPHLWLAFGVMHRGEDWVGATAVDAHSFESVGRFDYVCRFYDVGALSVRVRLSKLKLKDDWHPSRTSRFIIADLVGA